MKSDGLWDTRDNELPWTEAEWERFIRAHDAPRARMVPVLDEDLALARELGLSELPVAPTIAEARREDFGDEEFAQIRYIPAFRLAFDFADEIHRTWEAAQARPAEPTELVNLLGDLAAEAQCIAQQIASGHGIGYEDHHICGNIVKCREALRHVERSIVLLQRLRSKATGDRRLDDLLATAVFMRLALQERIAALRTRVWWDDRRTTA